MTAPVNLLLIGAAGRMGQAIARIVASGSPAGFRIAAALEAHLIPSLPDPFQTMSPLAIRKEMTRSLTDCDTEASTRPRGPIRTRCARAPQCDRRGLTPPGSPGCNYPQNRSVR